MRQFLVALALCALVSIAAAQDSNKKDPLLHPRNHAGTPKAPKLSALPKQHGAGAFAPPAPATNAKPGSLESQLTQLERQTNRTGSTASKKAALPAAGLPKSTEPSKGKKIDFKYQQPKGATGSTQAAQGAKNQSGVRRRVTGH